MKYRESEEMYLETILLLSKENLNVRSIDIANHLDYSRPSVSRAVNLLQKKNYINVAKDGRITFTNEGYNKAIHIYEKHNIITSLLIKIGANEEMAEDNACRFEHVITDELLEIMKKYLNEK